MKINYSVDLIRINELENNTWVNIVGWALTDTYEVPSLILKINGKREKFESAIKPRPDVFITLERKRKAEVEKQNKTYKEIQGTEENLNNGFIILVRHYPEKIQTLELIAVCHGKREELMNLSGVKMKQLKTHEHILLHADEADYEDKIGLYTVDGTVFSYESEPISLNVLDDHGNKVESYIEKMRKPNFAEEMMLEKEDAAGFKISFHGKEGGHYTISAAAESGSATADVQQAMHHRHIIAGARRIAARVFNWQNILTTTSYVKKYGFHRTFNKVTSILFPGEYYDRWFKAQRVTKEELERQKNVKFDYEPKISLVVPMFNTPVEYLDEMISTVVGQSYSNWELCVADGSDVSHPAHKAIGKYAAKDPRIKLIYLDKNYGISGNTNKALELVTGDYTALYDHDDYLEKDALFEVVKAINENGAEVIYTDEDKFSMKTKRYEYPHFKTDYAPDLLCSHNYITHLFVVKTSIMKEVGGFRSYYDGAQDYDMILRCTEKTDRIYHIPRILYHWRMHANSTAADPSSKMYCYVAGQRAIADHLKRIGIEDARVEMLQTYYGYYHAIYEVKDKPLVSIIIPNKDGRETLERCIRSLYRINAYKNIEIIVVENNSTSKDIFTYYHQLQAEHDNIQIVTWPGKTFNYSAINNYGVTFARGDYLLFLNNDTEMINPDSITEMVGHAERAWTGAVGAKLLYEDDSIQHAGLIIGLGGVANSPFLHVNKMAAGYMMRDLINVNYSAVTAACMMVRKSLFEEAGGFDEDLAVAFNDVDFCLKLRKLGKYNVFNAFSLWHHYESVSRGYEDTPEKKARLQKETDLIKEKWPDIFRNGDPYYNPSFDTVKAFELKKIKN